MELPFSKPEQRQTLSISIFQRKKQCSGKTKAKTKTVREEKRKRSPVVVTALLPAQSPKLPLEPCVNEAGETTGGRGRPDTHGACGPAPYVSWQANSTVKDSALTSPLELSAICLEAGPQDSDLG